MRIMKWCLIALLLAGITSLDAGENRSARKTNEYRITKLTPFLETLCSLRLMSGKTICGKMIQITPQQVTFIAGTGPFHQGVKKIPIYSILEIKNPVLEQVFIANKTALPLMKPVVESDNNLEELFTILNAAEIPVLAEPGKDVHPVKLLPQNMKKNEKKSDETQAVDLINSQATNENE